jgi:hypothetical protein
MASLPEPNNGPRPEEPFYILPSPMDSVAPADRRRRRRSFARFARRKTSLYGLGFFTQSMMGVFSCAVTAVVMRVLGNIPALPIQGVDLTTESMQVLAVAGLLIFSVYAHAGWRWPWHTLGLLIGLLLLGVLSISWDG